MIKKKIISVLLCALMCVVVVSMSGCTTTTSSTTLSVYAADSLSTVFNTTGAAYTANNTGTNFTFNYAGSDVLATDILQGATPDVFASANLAQMQNVENAGLMNNSTVVPFIANKLALIVPTANPKNITTLADLATPGIKIDIANSSVPVGNYTLQMLALASNNTTYGSGFAKSFMSNVVSEETQVNDVVVKVATGEADAGIVYISQVPPAYQTQVKLISIPDSVNPLAKYYIGVLSASKNVQQAQNFINYVLSPGGQATLENAGFIALPTSNATTAAAATSAVTSQSATTAAAT
jgi:molybdate transport system substrate-binding protein